MATSLTSDVVMPEKVSILGKEYTITGFSADVFRENNVFTSIVLPTTISAIPPYAFLNCNALRTIVIPDSVKTIGYGAFDGCGNVNIIANKTIYMYENQTLLCAPRNATEFEVPLGTRYLGSYAFAGCKDIKTVTLSRTVEEVEGNAFKDCVSLTDIYIYSKADVWRNWSSFDGVDISKITLHVYKSMHEYYKSNWGSEFKFALMDDPEPIDLVVTVEEMYQLENAINNALKEKDGSIFDVASIKVTGPLDRYNDLRLLRTMASGVYSLADIDLSDATIDTNTIPNSAFNNCKHLRTIKIPTSVKVMENDAFNSCQNLESIEGYEGIDDARAWERWHLFGNCPKLEQPIYSSKVFMYLPVSITGDYEIPSGIEQMTVGSLINAKISSLTLPASLTDIGDDSFYDCSQLSKITSLAIVPPVAHLDPWDRNFNRDECDLFVPAAALDAYKNAEGWSGFKNIYPIAMGDLVPFAFNVETAGTLCNEFFDAELKKAGIEDKSLISELTITGTLNADDWMWVKDSLLTSCYYATKLDMSGATVADMAVITRDDVLSVSTLLLPEGIERIEEQTFYGNKRVKHISLPQSLKSVGHYAFAESNVEEMVIPDGVTEIGESVFNNSRALKSLVVGKSVKTIPYYFANYAQSLDSVVLLGNVKEFAYRAFANTNIKNFTCYAKNAPAVNYSSFDNVDLSESTLHVYENFVDVYSNAEIWKDFGNIVGDLGELETIDLVVDVPEYDGFAEAFDKAVKALEIESLEDVLFSKLTITGKMSYYDGNTYRQMVRDGWSFSIVDLSDVEFNDNYLQDHMFDSNRSLKEVVLPEGLKTIGYGAFCNCTSLTSIEIPSSVEAIREEAFRNCVNLEKVTGLDNVNNSEQYTQWNIFEGCNKITQPLYGNKVFFYLPKSYSGKYEVPEGIEQMTSASMGNCSQLTELVLPASMKYLGDDVLWGCYGVTKITSNAINPPLLYQGTCEYEFNKDNVTVWVPSISLETYKSATEWCDFKNYETFEVEGIVEEFAINVDTAGILNDELFEAALAKEGVDKNRILKLKVTGTINADDFAWLMQLSNNANCLTSLDMKEANTTNDFNSIQYEMTRDMKYTSIALPEGIETLNGSAFEYLRNLQVVSIPKSVANIYNYAFNGTSLKELYLYPENIPYVNGGWVFGNIDLSKATLHTYVELVDILKGEDVWKNFGTILGDLGNVGSLGEMDPAEYAALCKIYNTLDGDNWKRKWSIDRNNLLLAAWRGVTFEDGHVVRIDLADNNLTGDISKLTLELPYLTYLNMGYNNLEGDVAPMANSLTELRELYLRNNSLTDVSEMISANINLDP